MSALNLLIRPLLIQAKVHFSLNALMLALLCALGVSGLPSVALAQTDVGYLDFSYSSGVGSNSEVTAEKPESKLWWNDGYWWASMWSNSDNAYHIFRLDLSDQTWDNMGTELDDRKKTKADVLWDASTSKLYVASHVWSQTGSAASSGDEGKLFRYSYSGGTYTLDAGFPVNVNSAKTEALVLAKDSTGMLWVTYVESSKVMINHTIGGNDANWATPMQVPVGSAADVKSDDMSSIVSYDGHIGVMWSSQKSGAKMYFATHKDSDGASSNWQVASAYTVSGDDHINLKSLQSDAAGKLFAVVKTSFSTSSNPHKPYAVVLACTAGNCSSASNWSAHTAYWTDEGDITRPMLLLDTSNREVYVFTRVRYDLPGHDAGIYYKKSSIDTINFASGIGTPFIKLADATNINDPTSTKQTVNSTTGLVVLASDASARVYAHGCISLASGGGGACTQSSQPTVSFSSSSYSKAENGGSATIEVTLSSASASAVTVGYATSNGSATAGSDYTASTGTLTFAANATSRTFSVPIQDDALDEMDETINLTLSSPSGALLGSPSTATLTILDNEPTPQVQIENGSYTVDEDGNALDVNVTLSAISGQSVTVKYATSNGTATAGSDYVNASGTLTFAAGETTKNVQLTISDDLLDEENETFSLALSNPSAADLGTVNSAEVTINDNDGAPSLQFGAADFSVAEDGGTATISVLLSAASGRQITVGYATGNGTAQAASDYVGSSGTLTFAPGETSKSLAIVVNNDGLDEDDETFTVDLSSPVSATLGGISRTTLTITDDDAPPVVQFDQASHGAAEADGAAAINILLSAASGRTVTVDFVANDGSATVGEDYVASNQTLTFAPGEIAKSVSITLLNDASDETSETVQLALSNPDNATLGALSTSTLTIEDDDPPPTVQFGRANFNVDEGAGTATISLTLSAASSLPIAVEVAASDGTAHNGSDYTTTSGTINFAPGQSSQTVTLSILEDVLDEGDETVNLVLGNPTNAVLGQTANAVLTITDNDATVQFGSASYSVAEEAGAATVEVTLNAALSHVVTVHFATSNGAAVAGADYTASSGTLTFATGETSKSLLIQIADDALDEMDESFSLVLTEPNGASLGAPALVSLTIVDNDAPPTVHFSTSGRNVNEDVGITTIDVLLSGPSGLPVTVDYLISSETATAGSDYTASSGAFIFAPGETSQAIAIAVGDDALVEENETVLLALRAPGNASLGTPAEATLTIIDNDGAVTVQFGQPAGITEELAGAATLEVTLSRAATEVVSVDFAATQGSAIAGRDFISHTGTLTFAPGEISQTFGVTILDDDIDEADETIMLTLAAPINASLGAPQQATLTITDNDAPPTVQFGQAEWGVPQGAAEFAIEITLSSASEMTITVEYASGEPQIVGAGEARIAGELIFAPGETSKSILIAPSALISELHNGISVLLTNVTNATLGAQSSTTLKLTEEAMRIYLPLAER